MRKLLVGLMLVVGVVTTAQADHWYPIPNTDAHFQIESAIIYTNRATGYRESFSTWVRYPDEGVVKYRTLNVSCRNHDFVVLNDGRVHTKGYVNPGHYLWPVRQSLC